MRVDVEREPALRKEIMITFKQTVALIIEMVLHYNIALFLNDGPGIIDISSYICYIHLYAPQTIRTTPNAQETYT